MKVETTIAFWTWTWRWELILLASVTVFLYLRGWQQRRTSDLPSAHAQLCLFLSGTAVLLIGWISPIHALSTHLFSMRVVQDLLLVALGPSLLLAGNPILMLAAGLPATWRRAVQNQQWSSLAQRHRGTLQRTWQAATAPGTAFFLFIAGVWIWYDPWVHQATLTYPRLHNLQTMLLPLLALLYWRHILMTAPYAHRPLPPLVRVAYTAMGTGPVKMIGLILLFNGQELYTYPGSVQLTGLNINDYHLGAMMAWMLGGTVFSTTAVLQMRAWLGQEAEKPLPPHLSWDSEHAMKAPGFPERAGSTPLRQSQPLN